MNILFAYRNWLHPNRGGVGRVADTLAKYFGKNGHNVYYLNYQFEDKDDYLFPAKIYTLPDADFYSSTNLRFYHHLLNELTIDIVINHDASNKRSGFWLNTGKHTAKKISFYHTDPLHGLKRKVGYGKVPNYIVRKLRAIKYRVAMSVLLKNSDKLVVLSETFKKNIKKELMLNTDKIVSISNPCISSSIKPSVNKKEQVLFVGRLDWSSKRPDKMLRIWSRLFKNHPDWEILVLGDGPDRVKTEKLAKELKLKNIIFKGFVNPEPYYNQASIICLTSDYEGFGLAMVEAMQFGVVPIAFNNWASLTDVIEHKKTGLIVKSNDMDDFIAKLDDLMTDKKGRQQMAVNGIEYIHKFHIDVIGPQWIELLKSCMNNNLK